MSRQLLVDTPSTASGFSPSPRRRVPPHVVAIQPDRIGPNNGFAIAVLVISIVAIIVCILIVFLVKPCPRGREGRVEVIVDDTPSDGETVASLAAAVVSPTSKGAKNEVNPGGVIVEPTSKAELEKAIAKGKSVVMFHASWCGHCQSTGPEYRKAAADMQKVCPGLTVIMADGDKCREALGPNGIQGFPTIKSYKDGKAGDEYTGNRTAKSFVDFAKKACV
jgi:thiol-disulfide isomerase/thioredoxin